MYVSDGGVFTSVMVGREEGDGEVCTSVVVGGTKVMVGGVCVTGDGEGQG